MQELTFFEFDILQGSLVRENWATSLWESEATPEVNERATAKRARRLKLAHLPLALLIPALRNSSLFKAWLTQSRLYLSPKEF